jgi:type VI secretion system protein ImpI
MTLTLEVTGAKAAAVRERRKTFQESGGTIGRSAGKPGVTHWHLPDDKVSKDHALISFSNGTFFIADRSTNGIFLGSSKNRLESRRAHPLSSDETIYIEPYTIRVTIESNPSAFDDDPSADFGRSDSRRTPPTPLRPNESDDVVDPLIALGIGPEPKSAVPSPVIPDLNRDPEREHYRPPSPVPGPPAADVIPSDWWKRDSSINPVPAPPSSGAIPGGAEQKQHADPTPRVRSGEAGPDVGLAAVLAGAGLENVVVTPELARNFGQILRVVVEGVRDVLQVRQELKREFRLDQTMFKAADNNPLKFSASVDDALHNLLVKRIAGYLAPVEAFEDAFDDVRNHQVAILAGLRVAFDAMLAEFDPDRLQEEFDRQTKKGALLSMPAKLRYWDQYRSKIHDMVRDTEACYRKLFGDEFARAYEEQLSSLKRQGRSSKP